MLSCQAPNAFDKYVSMRTHILYMCERDGISPPVVAMGKHRSKRDEISPTVIALCVSKEPAYLHAQAAYTEWLWIIGEKWNAHKEEPDRDTQRSPDGYRGIWILGMVSGV
jgi:hypothetical protein